MFIKYEVFSPRTQVGARRRDRPTRPTESAIRDGRRVGARKRFGLHVLGEEVPTDEVAAGIRKARLRVVVLVHAAGLLEVGDEQMLRLVCKFGGLGPVAEVQET